jgi:protein TonB
MKPSVQRGIAILVSVLLHGLILFIVFPTPVIVITPDQNSIQVPVKFIVKTTPPKAESPPAPPIPDPITEKKAPTKPTPKPEAPAAAAPESLPGDRAVAVVAKHTVPIYPKSALNQGLTGTVVVDFAIDTQGAPTRYKIITSSGHDILDNAFIQTVMRYYTFEPKRVMGQNMPGAIRLSYSFELEDTQ